MGDPATAVDEIDSHTEIEYMTWCLEHEAAWWKSDDLGCTGRYGWATRCRPAALYHGSAIGDTDG